MAVAFVLLVLTLFNLHCVTPKRVSELEVCQKNLKKLSTVIRSFANTVNFIEFDHNMLTRPTNCADLLYMGNTDSGIYTIYPRLWSGMLDNTLSVYCDMTTEGGGWIMLQRRDDYEPRQDFFQDWETYKKGFGELDKDFWLGNENWHVLSNQENVTLRIDLEDFNGTEVYAKYDEFKISNCEDKYSLHIGKYSGNAGDSLIYHNDTHFVTSDNGDKENCAGGSKGGWWYKKCYTSHLTGEYRKGVSRTDGGMSWGTFRGDKYSLKKSEVKIRPSNFRKPE